MVTICAMTATIMQALDTTIANVALPYMQGSLSASQDQINWVLTSYIVAAAIMTAPVGLDRQSLRPQTDIHYLLRRIHDRILLCGVAQDINQMVLFRLPAGACSARRWCRCRRRSCWTPMRCMSAPRRCRSGAWAS